MREGLTGTEHLKAAVRSFADGDDVNAQLHASMASAIFGHEAIRPSPPDSARCDDCSWQMTSHEHGEDWLHEEAAEHTEKTGHTVMVDETLV